MSDPEKFIERWSRLKQEAAVPAKDATLEQARRQQAKPSGDPARQPDPVAGGKEDESAAFDPNSLPSIESILADTDIRPFLASGVPEELKRAALQRAWRADPAIRDFIGLSENSWDFNDPNGAHGFGPLEMSDELKQMVARMFDPPLPEPDQNDEEKRQAKAEDPESLATPPELEKASAQISVNALTVDRMRDAPVAAQQDADDEKVSDRSQKRTHGSALPK